jgi:hypothetical protein
MKYEIPSEHIININDGEDCELIIDTLHNDIFLDFNDDFKNEIREINKEFGD